MGKINFSNPPRHVAIIMDGNGRWARKRRLPKIAGHRAGIRSIEEVLRSARESGVGILTLYAFSTENWKRPKREVDALMKLLENYLDRQTQRLADEGVRLHPIGKIASLPAPIQLKLRKAEEKTIKNTSLLLNIALNYGSREEIVSAIKKICEDVREKRLAASQIDENNFSDYLYTAGQPDPDLVIRTSGEMRLSNFLLWQSSYAEIYVTEKLWPDFGKKDFEKAILTYRERERRYGG